MKKNKLGYHYFLFFNFVVDKRVIHQALREALVNTLVHADIEEQYELEQTIMTLYV
jgi:hypothetical protein